MRRCSSIAASFLLFLTLPLWAQHNPGAHGISGGGVQSHVVRSSGIANSRHQFANYKNIHGNRSFGPRAIHSQRVGRGGSYRNGFRGRRSYRYGAYGPYFGWYWNPYYYSDYPNNYGDSDSANYADDEQAEPVPPYRNDSAADDTLQRDMQVLNGKLDRLQSDVQSRGRANANDLQPSTALVFRDQHVVEVRNYAISGGTLWVVTEQQSRKIPLADLDLQATAKMNDERGVDFQVPK